MIALPLQSVDDSSSSLRRNLLLGGAVLFLAQTALIWLIAGRVSRPVTAMSQAARRIADGELETEIGDPMGSAETVDLADDLSRMVSRLRTTIEDSRQAAVDAETAREDMQQFLADASHELRTPLTSLRGYSELYASGALTGGGDVDRAMARIGSESKRMERLVTDMLQANRGPTVTEDVPLDEVVGNVADDLAAAFPDRDLQTRIDEAPTVIGDPARLHQALLNLGANAFGHTDDDVTVTIALSVQNGLATVDVVDHGPGIAAADREVIFRPFSRGESSRSRRHHDGAGLGLAIVRRIADEHQGSVRVLDTPGGGATFRFALPLVTNL